jgi:hypothetical protein
MPRLGCVSVPHFFVTAPEAFVYGIDSAAFVLFSALACHERW